MTMDLRSKGRKLSFDILSDLDSSVDHHSTTFPRSNSDPIPVSGDDSKANRRNRKKKKKRKCTTIESFTMNPIAEHSTPFPDSIDACNASDEVPLESTFQNYVCHSGGGGSVICQELGLPEESVTSMSQVSMGELRQRSVNTGVGAGINIGYSEEELSVTPLPIAVSISWAGEIGKEELSPSLKPRSDLPNGKLQTEGSLDWKQLMADDPSYPFLVESSPFRYFMEEMCHGNSLQSTTALGNDKERERVYDAIFRLPWRCELYLQSCH